MARFSQLIILILQIPLKETDLGLVEGAQENVLEIALTHAIGTKKSGFIAELSRKMQNMQQNVLPFHLQQNNLFLIQINLAEPWNFVQAKKRFPIQIEKPWPR